MNRLIQTFILIFIIYLAYNWGFYNGRIAVLNELGLSVHTLKSIDKNIDFFIQQPNLTDLIYGPL